MGYNESMTALADAVRAKSGATGKLTVDQMTEAVNGITSGCGEGGGGTDTSDATVTADKLLKGVTAYGANGKVTGEIETVTPTLTDNVFTVPSGFIEEPQTLTVPEMPPLSVHLNAVVVGPGYNPESKSIQVGKIASITEVTPGTSDVVIPADTYISRDIAVKGDSNLTPENIKEGVPIFGVVGSFAGGGGSESSNETILYMPMNGNFRMYGSAKYIKANPVERSEWDGDSDWGGAFEEGKFSGEQALSFVREGEYDEEGYPMGEMYYKYVKLPIVGEFVLSDFTWDLWAYIDDKTIGHKIMCFCRYDPLAINRDANGNVGFHILDSYGGTYYTGPLPASEDNWYHLAIVRRDNNMSFFVNGLSVKNASVSYTADSYNLYNGGFIGDDSAEASCRIAHVRLLNYALWTENFTPPTQASYAQFMN